MGINNSTNLLNTSKFIVDPTPGFGMYTTIQSAINAASPGTDIFIRPGTYTENLSLKPNVNLVGFAGDSESDQVIILGKMTYAGGGTLSISNILLQTNSDFFLLVSGSSQAVVYLIRCNLHCLSSTGISFVNSYSLSAIFIESCYGDLAAGYAYWDSTSPGSIEVWEGRLMNSGGSTTYSTNSAGPVNFFNSFMIVPMQSTGTGSFLYINTSNNTANSCIPVIANGNGNNNYFAHSTLAGGTFSALSIGAGVVAFSDNSVFSSANANVITGAGTFAYGIASTEQTSASMNVATQTPLAVFAGNVDAAQYAINNSAIINSALIPVVADGSYVVASGTRLNGQFWLTWDNGGAVIQETLISVCVSQNDNGANLNVLANRGFTYPSNNVFTDLNIALDASGIPGLIVTIGNRGGTTGNLQIGYYGNFGEPLDGTRVVLAPQGYVVASYIPYGGLSLDFASNLAAGYKEDNSTTYPSPCHLLQHFMISGSTAGNGIGAAQQYWHEQANGAEINGAVTYSIAPNAGTNVATCDWRVQTNTTGSLADQFWVNGTGLSTNGTDFFQYSEGSFTPTLQGGTVPGATTYVVQDGIYTRDGNRVEFDLIVAWSAATGTGDLQIAGMPFTAFNNPQVQSCCSCIPASIPLPAGTIDVTANVIINTTYCMLFSTIDNAVSTKTQMNNVGSVRISGNFNV